MPNKLLFLLCITLLFACRTEQTNKHQNGARYTGAIAKEAMVVSAHPEASRIGVEILKKGGNAVDAAVAVQFALAVCYPSAGNLGGGGFMLVRLENGQYTSLDFREVAPNAAHRDLYLDSLGNVIPRLSLDGHLAAGVPGSVMGCVTAHARLGGKLKWPELVQPAIDLAAKGFPLTHKQAKRIIKYQEDFKKFNTDNTYFQQKISPHGGDTLKQADLAHTLSLIRDNGPSGFYEGETADKIVAEMERGGGIMTHGDLVSYKAQWRVPVEDDYKDYKIASMGPPSSGGIALLQMLEILEDENLSEWGYNSAKTIHAMTEAERLAYADRATHLGDPGFWKVPTKELISADYIAERKKLINPNKATRSAAIKAGNPTNESEETTHFSIVDKNGLAVSVTTTLNATYGSKTFVSGAGFLLNNEMDDFSSKPGVPNYYGLVGGEANAIAPNKRMLSSMTPTIIDKDGKLFMVVGTPGGSTIITSVMQTFLNVAEHDMGMQEAVNALRVHHQWLPDSLYIEEGAISSTTQQELEEMGHFVTVREPIGRVDAILVKPDGTLEGGADIRGDDAAFGY